jgi:hypothetical protein
VLRRGRDTTERPDHVHRAAVAHWPFRRGQRSGRTTGRYGATSSRGVLRLKAIPMRALGRAETNETRLVSKGCHRRLWRAWPEHDKPVNRSSSYRPLPIVTSYHEHQRVMRERGWGPEKYESGRDELAMVERDGDGATVKSERGEVGNAAYRERGCPPRGGR